MYGPHITILVLNVVPHLNSMVYSKFPASRASVNNCGVVQDDRREPPRIEGHRPGPLGILSDHESLLATTARCQWPRATGSPSKGRVSFILVHFPEQRPPEVARKTFPSSHLEPVRLSEERLMVTFLSDAPAWPLFLPQRAQFGGRM